MDPEKLAKYDLKLPAKADEAVRAAQKSALEAGHSVLIVEDGHLLRKFPDGKRKRVGWIGRRIRVETDEAVPIKWRIEFPE